jgi:hypothetical protein
VAIKKKAGYKNLFIHEVQTLNNLSGYFKLNFGVTFGLTGEKVTNKCTVIVYFSLKFICLQVFITPTCFGYSLAIIRVHVIWYSGRTMCVFSKIRLFA